MTTILVGQAYHLRFDPKLWAAMQPYVPLGSLYAAAVAREAGYDVAVHDAMLADGVDDWRAAIDRCRPRYALLYEDNFNYLTKMCLTRMREAAVEMIAFAKRRDCTVIVCGSDATDHPARYLDARADFVIRGEGEETLLELLAHLEGGGAPLESIGSLSFYRDGERVDTPTRSPMRQLDDLPRPAWDLVDVVRYKRAWQQRHGSFSMNLVTTRGCPYHCNWCAKPLWGQRYNMHSPGYVADQVAWLQDQWQPDHIWFMDDIMGLKKGWFGRFADALEERQRSLRFKCLSRADLLLRAGEIESMARAGCEIVWIGAESGSQAILDGMDKGTKVEEIYEAARSLRDHGVQVAFFLQFGYPGEGRAEIEATRQMIRECAPDDIGISVSYPLPGTRFHHMVREQLGTKRNWEDSSDLAMMFRGPFVTEFYRHLHVVIHREYRSQRTENSLAGRRGGWPSGKVGPRHLARYVLDKAALLADERRLDRLAAIPHQGVGPVDSKMTHEQAATPSPQA